jgi:circadian clock protein KaiB
VTEFSLRLYIAGDSITSRRARQQLARIREILKQHKFDVETIDVLAQPQLAEQEKILATPTLAYEHAGRPKRIVGDLSDTKRVLEFLGIQLKDGKA